MTAWWSPTCAPVRPRQYPRWQESSFWWCWARGHRLTTALSRPRHYADSQFDNNTLTEHCSDRSIEFARPRAHQRKNDQACVPQKNPAVPGTPADGRHAPLTHPTNWPICEANATYKLIKKGGPSGAARAAVDLSVVRGVGSSTVVRGSVGFVSAGYRRRQADGGYKYDLAKRGSALQGVGLSSIRFHPIGTGPEDDKDGPVAWCMARIASVDG